MRTTLWSTPSAYPSYQPAAVVTCDAYGFHRPRPIDTKALVNRRIGQTLPRTAVPPHLARFQRGEVALYDDGDDSVSLCLRILTYSVDGVACADTCNSVLR